MQVYINGIGVWTPGMIGWPQAKSILSGAEAFAAQPASWPSPSILPAAERRRAPATVKLAVQVASDACAMARANAADMPCVFASSHGDTEISDYMCAELAQAEPGLSPTRFHNSVHNAASGYWTIAVGCMQPANAISAGADSFGTGLLEASAWTQSSTGAVLLVAYDMAAPAKLLPLCPIPQSFAVSLVLSPQRTAQSVACLRSIANAAQQHVALSTELQALQHANPAAQALPLLQAVAQQRTATLSLASMSWEVTPCQ